jgi:hypothetical protein
MANSVDVRDGYGFRIATVYRLRRRQWFVIWLDWRPTPPHLRCRSFKSKRTAVGLVNEAISKRVT